MTLLEQIYHTFLQMAPYLMLGLAFAGLLHILFSKEFVNRHIGGSSLLSIIKASIFGVPLPLCSCGVIPTAVALRKAGASRSSTVSFLISTPQTGVDSIAATYGMLGPVFAVYRPIASFIMGIIGGISVKLFGEKGESTPAASLQSGMSADEDLPSGSLPLLQRIKRMFRYAFVIFLDDISIQLTGGIIIAGLIAFFIPADFFAGIGSGITGMLLMLVVGIPMYICATSSIPVALVLIAKGISPGAAFVFLAAGPATNAASLTVIIKALGKRTAALYVSVIAVSSILLGLLLDLLIGTFSWDMSILALPGHAHEGFSHSLPGLIISAFFTVLLTASLYRKYLSARVRRIINRIKGEKMSEDMKKLSIEGMTCNHCAANVDKTLREIPGIQKVEVRLEEKAAYVKGEFELETVRSKISEIGYQLKE